MDKQLPTAKLQNENLILNSTQLPNVILDEYLPVLNDTELRVLLVIARQTYGWHKQSDQISYSQLVQKTGRERAAIASALKELRQKGLVVVKDKSGVVLTTRAECIGKELFYSINTTSSESEQVNISKPINQFGKRNSESEHTKETYTKTITKVMGQVTKKLPSCPLLNGSSLKEKYPNGHNECVEYLTSEEEDRSQKFINRPKQFNAIHKILRAGFGFDQMDRTILQVEKKYGKGAWDYATLANWLEKGSARA